MNDQSRSLFVDLEKSGIDINNYEERRKYVKSMSFGDKIAIDLKNFDKDLELKKVQGIEACGYHVILRLVMPLLDDEHISRSASYRDFEKYTRNVGLVVAVGKDAYKGAKFLSGNWVNVGDFAVFSNYSGVRSSYNDIPLFCINDEQILYKTIFPELVNIG